MINIKIVYCKLSNVMNAFFFYNDDANPIIDLICRIKTTF